MPPLPQPPDHGLDPLNVGRLRRLRHRCRRLAVVVHHDTIAAVALSDTACGIGTCNGIGKVLRIKASTIPKLTVKRGSPATVIAASNLDRKALMIRSAFAAEQPGKAMTNSSPP